MELLPNNNPTIAVLVVRSYADRVANQLLGSHMGWADLSTCSHFDTQQPLLLSRKTKILSTTIVKGVRKSRRGFTMMILKGITRSFHDLSPLARQNISALMEFTHRMKTTACNQNQQNCSIGTTLWSFLMEQNFDLSRDRLRIDCFPKDQLDEICNALQDAVAPYGQIQMTPSASKCTHILHILRDGDTYWIGLHVTSECSIWNVKLNDNAAKEVLVDPTDPKTGEDIFPNVNVSSPVSRAYYKLDQLWSDSEIGALLSNVATFSGAVDLGAAPGGWTQLLWRQNQSFGYFSHGILAIDRGVLACRVAKLPSVEYLAADLSSDRVAMAVREKAPISLLVCDASTDSNEILENIVTLVEKLGVDCWTLPCVWVVTLKLPYKTVGSLERNLGKVVMSIPGIMSRVIELAFVNQNVLAKIKILHLMANSDSERTLVVLFDKIS
jgi:FtsJ-like methyltransferase